MRPVACRDQVSDCGAAQLDLQTAVREGTMSKPTIREWLKKFMETGSVRTTATGVWTALCAPVVDLFSASQNTH